MFLIKRNTPPQRPLGSLVITLEQNLNLSLYGERKPVTLLPIKTAIKQPMDIT